ncbi:MAG: hypothetical protein NTY63_09230 [Candidatus Bipolaricaulota bacterium]|nr:hypothetical protein [Candidatus Bipolaricaulota bacterium]
MKRLAVVLVVAILGVVLLCLGASEKLTNRSGATASGVVITFSEAVQITSYDNSVFPTQSPASGESESFTFSGGTLPAGGTFQVTWSPTGARVRSTEWIRQASAVTESGLHDARPSQQEPVLWSATPDMVEWLRHPQVVSFQASPEQAASWFVTCIGWGSGFDLEAQLLRTVPESIKRSVADERPYTLGFSTFTTSETAFARRPELVQASCVDIAGERCVVGWYQKGSVSPFYWGCTNNPVWQDYMIERACAAVDLGADAVLLDEIYGTPQSVYNAGGCFCEYCLAGFRDYLSSHYTAAQLQSKYRITDPKSFNYRDYVRAHGYAKQWKSGGASQVPLFGEYMAYQSGAVADVMRRVVGTVRQYATEKQGRYLPFTANIYELESSGMKFVDLFDWFTSEVGYKRLGYPPAASVAPLARLAAGLGKRVYFMTDIYTNADLMSRDSTDQLLRVLIADAYAGGGGFYLPYDIYAYDQASGVSPGRFTGELDQIGYYYRFVLDHQYLFEENSLRGGVAVLYPYCSVDAQLMSPAHQPFLDLSAALCDASIQYDVLVVGDGDHIGHMPTIDEARQYSWVLVPNKTVLSDQAAELLGQYAAAGGKVISYSQSAAAAIRRAGAPQSSVLEASDAVDDYFNTPSPTRLARLLAGLPDGVLAERIELTGDGKVPPANLNARSLVSDEQAVVHIVNYNYDMKSDTVAPTGRIRVSIPIRQLPSGVTDFNVYLLSPDLPGPVPTDAEVCGDRLCVDIDEAGIWTVVCFVSEGREQELLAETLGRLPELALGFVTPGDFAAPVTSQGPQQPLQQRQEVLDAAWAAIESARPSADRIDWSAIQPCLKFAASPTISFYYEGDRNLANARFWGRQGCHVRTCSAGVFDTGLAVKVELDASDRIGKYGYIVAFRLGTTSFYAMLYPDRLLARLAMDVQGQWNEIGSVSGALIQVGDRTVSAWFPRDLFAVVFPPEKLLASSVDFHIDYSEDGRRELFMFPGTGKAVRMP